MKNVMKVNPTGNVIGGKYILEDIDEYANFLKDEKDYYVVHDGKFHKDNMRAGIYYQGDLVHCIAYCRIYNKHHNVWPFMEPMKSFNKNLSDFRKEQKRNEKRNENRS